MYVCPADIQVVTYALDTPTLKSIELALPDRDGHYVNETLDVVLAPFEWSEGQLWTQVEARVRSYGGVAKYTSNWTLLDRTTFRSRMDLKGDSEGVFVSANEVKARARLALSERGGTHNSEHFTDFADGATDWGEQIEFFCCCMYGYFFTMLTTPQPTSGLHIKQQLFSVVKLLDFLQSGIKLRSKATPLSVGQFSPTGR